MKIYRIFCSDGQNFSREGIKPVWELKVSIFFLDAIWWVRGSSLLSFKTIGDGKVIRVFFPCRFSWINNTKTKRNRGWENIFTWIQKERWEKLNWFSVNSQKELRWGDSYEKGNRWYPKKEKGGTRYFHMNETCKEI